MKSELRKMRWVLDEGIPITPALRHLLGEVQVLSGRDINSIAISDAEVLLVRSITRVDAKLLQNSQVRFVGSATAGTDHLDVEALARSDIAWSAAPGSNAVAVVEYVLSAIALSGFLAPLLNGLPVGIVGLGEVGGRLANRLLQLGCSVVAHDPFIRDWPSNVTRVSLNEALCQPIVSLHASLHDQGPHASSGLLNLKNAECAVQAAERRGMGLFINAARGELITSEALTQLLDSPLTVILDTWPGEPLLSAAVLSDTDWVSPHIAGHSLEAKARGSNVLARALACWAGEDLKDLLSPGSSEILPAEQVIEDQGAACDAVDWATTFLKNQGTLAREDARIREAGLGALNACEFDKLRKTYRQPSEWSGRTIRIQTGSPELGEMATRLGMRVME